MRLCSFVRKNAKKQKNKDMKQKKTYKWCEMIGKTLVLMILTCLTMPNCTQKGMKGDTLPPYMRYNAPIPPPPPPPEKIKDPLDTTDSKGQPFFIHSDLPPTFKGDNKAMFAFIATHLKFPTISRECGIEGSVYVSFIVEKDGNLTDIHINRGLAGGLNEEAIRVVELMQGHWNPASYDGKPVRSVYTIPLKFKLE